MKKSILVITSVLFASVLYAQTDSSLNNINQLDPGRSMKSRDLDKKMNEDGVNPNHELNSNPKPDIENNRIKEIQNNPEEKINKSSTTISMPDGVMKMNGRIMFVNDGKLTSLDKEIMFKNGSRIMIDGTIIKKDGSRSMIHEGEHIDMSGNIIPIND